MYIRVADQHEVEWRGEWQSPYIGLHEPRRTVFDWWAHIDAQEPRCWVALHEGRAIFPRATTHLQDRVWYFRHLPQERFESIIRRWTH